MGTRKLSIRFSEDDYRAIKYTMERFGINNVSEFVRIACRAFTNSAFDKSAPPTSVVIDYESFYKIRRILSGIGTNVNQVAHAFNLSTKILKFAERVGAWELSDIQEIKIQMIDSNSFLQEAHSQINELVKQIPSITEYPPLLTKKPLFPKNDL